MMDKKDLLRLLKYRVREIESVLSSMESSGIIHEIETDLVLSKIRLMYEEVKKLSDFRSSLNFKEGVPGEIWPELIDQKVPGKDISNQKDQNAEVPSEEKEVHEPEDTGNAVQQDNSENEPGLANQDLNKPEKKLESEGNMQKSSVSPKDTKENKPESPGIVARQSKLKEPDGKLLTGIRMQAVDDIMVAIGLNDRFLFTRELFNNDPDLFRATVNELNQKGNLEEAISYLDENFSWDPDDPTLVLFLNFVKRRFI